MTGFMWQVLSAMMFPLLVIMGFVCALIPRPLPLGMLAAAGISICFLFMDYTAGDNIWRAGGRHPRPVLSFWGELPARALAGAVWTLLFGLIIRALVLALRPLLKPPDPPG